MSQMSSNVSVTPTHFQTRGSQTTLSTSPKIPHAHSISLGLKASFASLLHIVLQNSCDPFHQPWGCLFGNHIPHCCPSNTSHYIVFVRVPKTSTGHHAAYASKATIDKKRKKYKRVFKICLFLPCIANRKTFTRWRQNKAEDIHLRQTHNLQPNTHKGVRKGILNIEVCFMERFVRSRLTNSITKI